ncbi:MAG TPA: RHS repeat-associated core domain-containing protein [Pyrinomonadaceae bacterium]|nr:RHS repeat-associated core domain-containing protein [Pyrinomonadaceae bacterium]
MTPPKLSTLPVIVKYLACSTVLLLFTFHAVPVRADSTDGKTPLALQPGTPAGSYALSELDHINPFNGSLNFRLPLLNIGGRGTAGYMMTLPIEQKWRIHVTPIYLYVYDDGGNGPLPEPQVSYLYSPTANWWPGIRPGYGPGVMQGRVAQLDAQVCPDTTMRAVMTLTRLTFTAPDGTEFELRDAKTGGTAMGVGICDQVGFNREKIFVTVDGSAATFISDQNIVDDILLSSDVFSPSGYLLLRDGTRYRFDNGTVTWLRDRNGNTISFTYDAFKRATLIKDSLNRQVAITYATSSVLYDEITYKGFGGATRTIRINYAYLQDPGSLRSGYSIQTYAQLFPISGSSMNSNYNPKIVRSVTLPNNQQYQFQYNPYGELARVVLPTGGAFEYDHASGVAGDASGLTGGFEENSVNVYRRVTTKRVYADGTTLESKLTFSNTESVPCSGCVVIDQFGNDGVTRLSERRVYYEGSAVLSFYQSPTDYSPWKEGREYQSEAVAANGTTILQRVTRTWQQPVASASWPLTQAETNSAAKTNNPQITEVITTLEPSQANKVSKQTFAYDKYTNKTDVYEYDFGSGTVGALVRRSHIDFLTSSYDTLNPSAASPDLNLTSYIRNLPLQVSIFDSGGVERARSTTEYDNYALDGADCLHSFHCPLVPRANISGLDSLFGTSYTKRGNPTAATRYLLANGAVTGSVSTYSQFDVAGNIVRVLDPRSTLANNIATTIEYDDRFGTPNNEARSNSVPSELTGYTSFAFPTKVTNALGHTSYAQFDYYLGQPVNGEDTNGVVASGSFNDFLDRPTQIRRAIDTGAENQSTFAYDDTLRVVTVSSDKDAVGDNLLVSKVEYDQMGRTIAKQQYEGGDNYIVTKTEYDALGRPYKNSNPFRPWQGETAVWTTQQFDALGRVITVTTPDNAAVSTSYSGNTVTVTDQAGKARKIVMDALGRLIEVYEDPAGVSYQTTYLYDALDDLVRVTQDSQQRFFMYDSLKRLIRADNPEQETLSAVSITDQVTNHSNWSVKYEYDSNGNLTSKTDARGVVTQNSYDALNRPTTVLYRINGQPDPNTGDIEHLYDNAAYGKGRLWLTYRWGAKPSHTAIGQYDAVGRVKQLYNLFGDGQGGWSVGYEVKRDYNRAGQVTSQTYPSGRTVDYSYDTAGRTIGFTGKLGDGITRTYASSFIYNARSQVTQELFGTATLLYHKLQYNIRGQLWDVRVSTNPDVNGSMNRGGLQYFYDSSLGNGTSGPDNNGNVLFANTYTPEDEQDIKWAIHRQSYAYDSLNRLKSATEYFVNYSHPQSQQYVQTYDYDRWGNRVINTAQTSGTGINNKMFEIETARNRLYSPGDLALPESQRRIAYDKTGNQIKDTYTGYGTATFDGDNRIVAIQDKFAGSTTYTYNANAQRVRRRSNNEETWQIYGIEGELVAEYAANSPVTTPQKEYGYRDGQLLITAEPAAAQNVSWTNTAGVSVNGNSLTKIAATGWGNAGASSTQGITAGGGYVEVTATENSTARLFGLSHTDADQHWPSIDFGIDLDLSGSIYVFESGNNRGNFGPYTTGDKLQVAVVGGVVKYKKNGTVFYTSSVTPTYPLVVDTALHGNGCTLSNVVLNAARLEWLVPDHLGTPRIILDQTGTLQNLRRHDYLPFGEELFAGSGGRIAAMGYEVGDGVRQQFTQKEQDIETGLDYFLARYYSSVQGRFTSVDPANAGAEISDAQTWNGYAYVTNAPLNSTDPFGLWKEVDCTSGKGKCWESNNTYDTISSLAKILNVSASELNKHFQNPTIHIGDAFDVSGFGLGNIPIIQDPGPAFVQVLLVSEETPTDTYTRILGESYARHDEWAAGNRQLLYDWLVPQCAQERKCEMNIFFPGGFGVPGRITFSGTGQVVGHGARHLANLGLTQAEVEAAITADIQTIQASATATGSFWGAVTVRGHTIIYRAYTLADGTINVGTYYKP